MKSQSVLFFPFLLLGIAAVLIMLGNPLWWPCLIVGGLLFVRLLNDGRPELLWGWWFGRRRTLLTVLAIYAAIGLGQELTGRITGIPRLTTGGCWYLPSATPFRRCWR